MIHHVDNDGQGLFCWHSGHGGGATGATRGNGKGAGGLVSKKGSGIGDGDGAAVGYSTGYGCSYFAKTDNSRLPNGTVHYGNGEGL